MEKETHKDNKQAVKQENNDASGNHPDEREIDLREVFYGINNKFYQFFNWFTSCTINSLLFIKRYFKLIAIASLIGLILGVIYYQFGQPYYQSTMVIKSKDTYLEENIIKKILNELTIMCSVKDSIGLAKILQISISDANHLKSFELEEDEDPRNLAFAYKKYYQFLSSIEDKKEREELFELLAKSEYTRDIYSITVSSFDPTILPKLNEPLIELIAGNVYFNKRKEVKIKTLKKYKEKIFDELIKLDSLRVTLTNVIKREEGYKGGSNNIVLSETPKQNPLPVHEKYLSLQRAALDIDGQIMERENRVEILSGLVKLSQDMRISLMKGGIYGFILGFLVGAGIAFVISSWKYLNKLEMRQANI